MVKKCIQCGKNFELTGAEVHYFEEKGMEIPKHCRECRQTNRINKNSTVVPKGKARRQQRKTVLRSVPTTVFVFLVAIAFVYITFVRGGSQTSSPSGTQTTTPSNVQAAVMFRSEELWKEHYEKHGKEMGFESAEEYLAGANAAIQNPNALHKREKEDGDDVYYVQSTNDFVIVSTDGYIRTYFRPDDGIQYYNRQ